MGWRERATRDLHVLNVHLDLYHNPDAEQYTLSLISVSQYVMSVLGGSHKSKVGWSISALGLGRDWMSLARNS